MPEKLVWHSIFPCREMSKVLNLARSKMKKNKIPSLTISAVTPIRLLYGLASYFPQPFIFTLFFYIAWRIQL